MLLAGQLPPCLQRHARPLASTRRRLACCVPAAEHVVAKRNAATFQSAFVPTTSGGLVPLAEPHMCRLPAEASARNPGGYTKYFLAESGQLIQPHPLSRWERVLSAQLTCQPGSLD
jgi:hypothetical protein